MTSATNGSASTSFSYTSRGTTSAITTGGTATAITSDAYDEQVTNGSTGYTYDALGRLTTLSGGGTSRSLTYGDQSNNVTSDGAQRFSHTAAGDLLSTTINGTGQFLNVDGHGDVTGTFTTTGAGLTSSASYDPYGNVLATSGTRPDVGYQGGWTDPGTSFVNAASRWYNPNTGTFISADTQQNDPSPAVNANPYAYGNDNPLTNSDPTGHDACSAHLAGAAQLQAQQEAAEAAGDKIFQQLKNAADRQKEHLRDAQQAQDETQPDPSRPPTPNSPPAPAANGTPNPPYHGQGNFTSNSSQTAPGNSTSATKQKSKHWWQNPIVVAAGMTVGTMVLLNILPQLLVPTGAGMAEYDLAASDALTCSPGNAPSKPKDNAPKRTNGPTAAEDPAGTASKVDPNAQDAPRAPSDVPYIDEAADGQQTWWEQNGCIVLGIKRDGQSPKATAWDCGGAGRAGAATSTSGRAQEQAIAAKTGIDRNAGAGQQSITGPITGRSRIPDFDVNQSITKRGTMLESKDVGRLEYRSQIQDFESYANDVMGVPLEIVVRRGSGTSLPTSGGLADAINAGRIIVTPLDKL